MRINRLLDEIEILRQDVHRFNVTQSYDTLTLDDLRTETRTCIETASKGACKVASLDNDTALCRILTRYLMFVNTLDRSLAPHMMLDGYWEMWITQALLRHVKPGMHVVDIGANFGYYSLLLADCVGPKGHLWALEPNPQVFELMRQSMRINGLLGQSTLVQKACGSSDGERLILKVPVRFQGGATTVSYDFDPSPDPELKKFECETICLDTLLSDKGHVDFIKIDVEGAERSIWEGMQGVLQQNSHIVVVMEFDASRYADARGFLDQIMANGFMLRFIDSDASIRDVGVEQLLANPDFIMLWLQRG
jgi:FkbM family methyltransferase